MPGFLNAPRPLGEAAAALFECELPPKNHGSGSVQVAAQPIRPFTPGACRRSKRYVRPAVSSAPENVHSGPPPVLHFLPPHNSRGSRLVFHSFDASYLAQLRSGDFRTEEHFVAYFGALIKIKLNARLRSMEAVEDVRQETFSRFFLALREGKIQQPERLGSYVNSICNNVLLEHYRSAGRSVSVDFEDECNAPVSNVDLVGALLAKESKKKVREILEKLPERDRRLLRQVFLEERDKNEVCRELGVDREYLRVLLHRAKQAFKAMYLKNAGENPPDCAPI